jgi:hypothetical protein
MAQANRKSRIAPSLLNKFHLKTDPMKIMSHSSQQPNTGSPDPRVIRFKPVVCLFLVSVFLAASLVAQDTPPAVQNAQPAPTQSAVPFGMIAGTVKSGNVPLPGVTVTAANTLTGKKYITSTDVDGSFRLEVGSKGRYVVRAEFSAFAPLTQEILINAENRNGRADLAMILLSRAQRDAQQQQTQNQAGQLAAGMAGLGMQRLSLAAGDGAGTSGAASADSSAITSAGLPNAGLAAEGNTESVAVSGAMGRTEQPTFDPGEMQDRIAEMRDQGARQGGSFNLGGGSFNLGGGSLGGGPLGGGGGPMMIMMGGGGGGARGLRNFNINKPHGSIFYNYGGSPLDARPYSLTGEPAEKASYGQHRFGVVMGGPLNIPHIYHGGTKTFLFGTYTGSRGNNPYDVFSTVPTLAQRSGDFSQSSVQLFDPNTHTPFANNMVPSINPAAAGLLQFIPAPNLPGTSQNFHFVSANRTSTDIMFLRFNHSFGSDPASMFGAFGGPGGGGGGGRGRQQRQSNSGNQGNSGNQKKDSSHWSQSINGGFNYNNIRNDLLNPFPTLGGKQTVHNYNGNVGYNLTKGVFLNSLRFNYNRSGNNRLNNFTDHNNIESQLGIGGVSPLAADFGLPNVNLSPEFSSLQDISPVARTDQNFTFSDSMNWTHGKHGWSWGGDFRHQLIDLSNASNARGTFIFTGATTGGIGSDGKFHPGLPFADFLLGFAQETSVQFGAENYHFRANSFDLFVQDNWRAGKNLTFNLGLRYEYISPFTELHNKLVNLDIAPGFTSVVPVQAGQTGPFTGKFPAGVVNPDRNNFAPRVGIAWKPFSKTVVRTGYGVNYNLGQYATIATQLGFQPPFAFTQTNPASTPTALTLQNGFPPASNSAITNSYAVDRNYRLAYVQSWNLNIQQDIRSDMVLNIGYTGSKGTRLDIVRAPSLDANGVAINGAQPFLFESSEGSSVLHSGTVRLRKRMRHGLSLGGTYTYSKSIDNASSIGGGATVVAQNDRDLAAERGLSSFDQRHRFTADYYYDLPLGKDKKWLNSGSWEAKAFGGFAFSGNLTLASGFPFSPRIFGNAADIRRGITGAHRPDVVPGQSIQSGNQNILQWFNTAAFITPAGPFGDAGRNTIIGPGTIDFDMSFAKNIQLKEMQALELRFSANNIFNTAHFTSIDTTLGSPTFGRVVAAGSMRKAQITTRYRF